MLGSTNPALGSQSVFGSNNPCAPKPFGSTSLFGASSQPLFGSTSAPALPAFGATSTLAFGSSSTSTFGSTGTGAPAFGASLSSPAFGSSSTPLFGASSSPSFSFGSTPSFGQSNSAFGPQTSSFATSAFAGQRGGSRVAPYSPTAEVDGGNTTQPAAKLVSISSMTAYKQKSLQELRWEDYQLGDKGGSNHAAQSNPFGGCNPFGQTSSAFGQSTPFFDQPGGSRVAAYSPTTEVDGGSSTQPAGAGKLESISAMTVYKQKSHQQLRWEDYQLGDKGGPNPATQPAEQSNPFGGSSTSNPFGGSSTFGNPFGRTISAFGQSTPSFGQHWGSRVAAHSPTAEVDSGSSTQPADKLESISAITVGKEKSHEELRWVDYQQLGDKGGPNPATQQPAAQSNTFGGSSTSNAFGGTSTSTNPFSSSTSSNPFASLGQPNIFGTPATGRFGFPSSSTPSLLPTNNQTAQGTLGQFQSPVVMQPQPVSNPFGTLPTMPHMSIGPSGSPTVQYGISSMPVAQKPNPIRVSSLLTSRHISQRRDNSAARKYHPKNDGPKVPFYYDDEAPSNPNADAFFTLTENLRALSIGPKEKWPSKASLEKPSQLKDMAEPVHKNDGLAENGSDRERKDNQSANGVHEDKSTQKRDSYGHRSGDAASVHEQGTEIESVLPKLKHADYYTEPQIQELAAKERGEPGFCRRVKDFVVGRHGYGSIKFFGETDVRGLDLESIVEFNNREVIVYMDGSKKPPVGQGLNKPAEVTLLNVKCLDKKTGKQWTEGLRVENYRDVLMKKAQEHGIEFISYDPRKGEWKFKVNHFSSGDL